MIAGLMKGQWAAISAVYGVAVAMLIAWLLAKSIKIATVLPAQEAASAMVILYAGAVVRFVAVIILLGVGLWQFLLDPLPMLGGFAVIQLASPLLARKLRKKENT